MYCFQHCSVMYSSLFEQHRIFPVCAFLEYPAFVVAPTFRVLFLPLSATLFLYFEYFDLTHGVRSASAPRKSHSYRHKSESHAYLIRQLYPTDLTTSCRGSPALKYFWWTTP